MLDETATLSEEVENKIKKERIRKIREKKKLKKTKEVKEEEEKDHEEPSLKRKLQCFTVGRLNFSLQVALLATFMGEQGLVQELSSGPEMGGDVGIDKVVHLNALVGDVHA